MEWNYSYLKFSSKKSVPLFRFHVHGTAPLSTRTILEKKRIRKTKEILYYTILYHRRDILLKTVNPGQIFGGIKRAPRVRR